MVPSSRSRLLALGLPPLITCGGLLVCRYVFHADEWLDLGFLSEILWALVVVGACLGFGLTWLAIMAGTPVGERIMSSLAERPFDGW